MQASDNEHGIDHELAALFAGVAEDPVHDAEFIQGVMKGIRRQQQLRWLVLGGSGLIASVFAALFTLPALLDLGASIGGIASNSLLALPAWFDQATVVATDFFRAALRSVTFLAAATLAIVVIPLLRWLAD